MSIQVAVMAKPSVAYMVWKSVNITWSDKSMLSRWYRTFHFVDINGITQEKVNSLVSLALAVTKDTLDLGICRFSEVLDATIQVEDSNIFCRRTLLPHEFYINKI